MTNLKFLSDFLIREVSSAFHRFLFDEISLDEQIVGIVGPRGVGKTTLLLQLVKEKVDEKEGVLYVGLDGVYFSVHSLIDFAREFFMKGGSVLVLDDLHKYHDGVRELQEIAVEMPDLKILFASSSAGDTDGAFYELSKIAELHHLPGLSFREFLELRHGMVFQVIHMNELLEFNRTPGAEVLSRIRPLQYFDEYLAHGYYPYENDKPALYAQEVRSMLNRVLTEDFSAVHRIDYESVLKIRRMIAILAEAGPMKPNIEKLAEQSGTTRDSLLKFLKYLHQAGIIAWLTKGNEDINYFNKPDRLLLNNTCLIRALSAEQSNPRHLLEAFMLSQLQVSCQINLINPGRYLIDLLYEFEMAWVKSKGRVAKSNNAYILSADAESSSGGVIPLWMIGFLY